MKIFVLHDVWQTALDAERRSSLSGQRRIEAIFSSSNDAICVINEKGLIEAFNTTCENWVSLCSYRYHQTIQELWINLHHQSGARPVAPSVLPPTNLYWRLFPCSSLHLLIYTEISCSVARSTFQSILKYLAPLLIYTGGCCRVPRSTH